MSTEDEDGGDSEFVRRLPDIRFKNIGSSCFCMVDSTLYIFSAFVGDYSPPMRIIYSYKLLPKTSGVILDAADDSLGTANKTWNPIVGASLRGGIVEIEGFSVVNDRTFIVSTNLRRMFCIDLIFPDHGWQLYEEGVQLLGYHQTFVTRSGFNVDGSGVYCSTQPGNFEALLDMERNGCSESRLYFPPSSSLRGSYSYSSTFVEDYLRHRGTVFVVKIIFDDERNESYPYWAVDKLALDFEKLSAKDLVDVDDDEWAKCVASHKFIGELKSCCFICVALLPF